MYWATSIWVVRADLDKFAAVAAVLAGIWKEEGADDRLLMAMLMMRPWQQGVVGVAEVKRLTTQVPKTNPIQPVEGKWRASALEAAMRCVEAFFFWDGRR